MTKNHKKHHHNDHEKYLKTHEFSDELEHLEIKLALARIEETVENIALQLNAIIDAFIELELEGDDNNPHGCPCGSICCDCGEECDCDEFCTDCDCGECE